MGLHRDAEDGQPVGQVDGVGPGLEFDGVGVGLLQHPTAVLDGLAVGGAVESNGMSAITREP